MIHLIQRTLIYGLIAFFSIGFLYLVRDPSPVIPHGIYLPSTETIFAASVKPVTVLATAAPASAKQIGVINMQMRLVKDPSTAEEQQVMDSAKALASANGADFLIVNYFVASGEEASRAYLLQATAFKIA